MISSPRWLPESGFVISTRSEGQGYVFVALGEYPDTDGPLKQYLGRGWRIARAADFPETSLFGSDASVKEDDRVVVGRQVLLVCDREVAERAASEQIAEARALVDADMVRRGHYLPIPEDIYSEDDLPQKKPVPYLRWWRRIRVVVKAALLSAEQVDVAQHLALSGVGSPFASRWGRRVQYAEQSLSPAAQRMRRRWKKDGVSE